VNLHCNFSSHFCRSNGDAQAVRWLMKLKPAGLGSTEVGVRRYTKVRQSGRSAVENIDPRVVEQKTNHLQPQLGAGLAPTAKTNHMTVSSLAVYHVIQHVSGGLTDAVWLCWPNFSRWIFSFTSLKHPHSNELVTISLLLLGSSHVYLLPM
jgi:hypothetical protein